MGEHKCLEVLVCLALPDRQLMVPVTFLAAQTVEQTMAQIAATLSAFDPSWRQYSTAIFGKACAQSTLLVGGEQIELLRPLVADPKLARQRRVEIRRKAMGRTAWRRNSRAQKVQTTSE